MSDTDEPIVRFLERFIAALGIRAQIAADDTPDGVRLNIEGDEAELLVRHRGEPLKALQHVADVAFGRDLRDEKRVFVDALGYRRGKDTELRQMAKLLAEKAKQSGLDQQLGPLNPYERRPRAPGRRRSARSDDRERRRRIFQDRSDLPKTITR